MHIYIYIYIWDSTAISPTILSETQTSILVFLLFKCIARGVTFNALCVYCWKSFSLLFV